MCEKKDSCCQPHNCKLKRSSQCSDVSTPDCCKNCLVSNSRQYYKKTASDATGDTVFGIYMFKNIQCQNTHLQLTLTFIPNFYFYLKIQFHSLSTDFF